MLMIRALHECWFGDKTERVISLSENFFADVCAAHTNGCRHSIPRYELRPMIKHMSKAPQHQVGAAEEAKTEKSCNVTS